MEDCQYNGNVFFSSMYDEDTDGYLFDKTHWNHPMWSYEKCESYVFKAMPNNHR